MLLEHPKVKTISLNPGAILTELSKPVEVMKHLLVDSLQLPAATLLRLTSGRDEWLVGG